VSERSDRSSETLRMHTLPHSAFREICGGPVSPDIIRLMSTTQYSRRKLQLHALTGLARDNPTVAGPLTSTDEVWRLLVTIESRAPEIVEDVLMYPPVGAWLSRMVHRIASGESATTPLWTEFGYLHSTVAATAIRANMPMSIRVPVLHGAVNLPTAGHVRLPVTFPVGMAHMVADHRGVRLRGPSFDVTLPDDLTEPTADYQPTRTHMTEDGGRVLRLRIEDTDPYRAFTRPRRPHRLSPLDIADWAKLIDEAWHVLSTSHSHFAEEVSAGLTTVMPAAAEDELLAASSPSGFGGMMLSANESPVTMAELIVHELQHSKLNALLDLVTILDQPGEATEYAPWRQDPRPPIGLLHGIYAFASAVEFHRAQRRHSPSPDRKRADFLFAHRRAQVGEAISVVRGLRGLTDLGREFVDIVAGRIDTCDRDAVDVEVLRTVRAMTADHRATWRMRHHSFEPNCLDRPSVVPVDFVAYFAM
jgi:HEXXH motif-containing protein